MSRILPAILIAGVLAAVSVSVLAQDEPADERPGKPAAERPRPPRGPGQFFARHDVNKDGKVTLEELYAPAKKLMKELDADGDGAITKEEFEAGRKDRRPRRGEGEGAGAAGRRGPGGEGRGPRGEGGAGQRPERPSPEDVFQRLDTNADGQLSLEEFKAGARRRAPRGGGRR